MSHQCLADAYAPALARYKAKMQEYTFGHLAPEKNTTYRGFILFANSVYDGMCVIDSGFSNDKVKLADSPWLFEAMDNFCYSHKPELGGVYRFDGSFRNYYFRGKIQKIDTVQPLSKKEKPTPAMSL